MPLYTSNFNTIGIKDSSTAFYLKLLADSSNNLSQNRNLTISPADSNLNLAITGNATLNQNVSSSGSPSFADLLLSNGGSLKSSTIAGNTLRVQAYDTDGFSYTTFITLTANNTPTCDLSSAVTFGGKTLASTTYTPTLTNVTNVAASTVQDAQYIRFGNVVASSGRLTIDPTSASIATEVGLSLPIASTTSLFTMVAGSCICSNSVSLGAGIEADITNNRAAIRYINTAELASKTFHYVMIYLIA